MNDCIRFGVLTFSAGQERKAGPRGREENSLASRARQTPRDDSNPVSHAPGNSAGTNYYAGCDYCLLLT